MPNSIIVGHSFIEHDHRPISSTTATVLYIILPLQLEPGNKEAVRAARRIKDKVAKAVKLNTPIVQVRNRILGWKNVKHFGVYEYNVGY